MKSARERFSRIKKIGLERDTFQDLYHQVLTMSWTKFFGLYVLVFFLFNVLFALLYYLSPGGVTNAEGDFFKDFAFSVQTFSTIGYGVFAPNTEVAHVLVIAESMLGVLFTALLTGLAFAKFARPTARIQFTDKVVVTKYNGRPTLMFRLANLRGNQIADAAVTAVALMSEKSSEGTTMRLQKDLTFVRSRSSFFILTWTVMHVIDDRSPLYNLSHQQIIDKNIEISISVIGHDETFSQTVHSSGFYGPEDFVFDRDFADMITTSQGGAVVIDYTQFNALKEVGVN